MRQSAVAGKAGVKIVLSAAHNEFKVDQCSCYARAVCRITKRWTPGVHSEIAICRQKGRRRAGISMRESPSPSFLALSRAIYSLLDRGGSRDRLVACFEIQKRFSTLWDCRQNSFALHKRLAFTSRTRITSKKVKKSWRVKVNRLIMNPFIILEVWVKNRLGCRNVHYIAVI